MAKKGQKAPGVGGRKWFDGKDEKIVLSKLSECWALDSTDEEASFYAEISPASLSRYLDSHPEVAERKAALKERPILLARRAVIESFDGHEIEILEGKKKVKVQAPKSPETALKYLERKRKKEFSTLQKVEGEFEGKIETSDPATESLKNDIAGLNEALTREIAEIAKLQAAIKAKPRKK